MPSNRAQVLIASNDKNQENGLFLTSEHDMIHLMLAPSRCPSLSFFPSCFVGLVGHRSKEMDKILNSAERLF